MKVVYYKMLTLEHKGKRLAKFTAHLRMLSDKRGVVEKVKISPVDKNDKLSQEFMKFLVQNEIGRTKNIKSCYSSEENDAS